MLILKDLVRYSNDELKALDLAEVNCACTAGLPAPESDAQASSAVIDEYAGLVKAHTEASLPRWRERPQDYARREEAYFRIRCMAEVFTQTLGLRFDPDAFDSGLYPKAGSSFLFGLTATRRGTHATLPVLWAAVGRRLGYPIKLVSGRWRRTGNSHLFPRWDELGGIGINIEMTPQGLRCFPTDHYRNSPDFFVPPEEEKRRCLLRPKTPREELALFLTGRGHCWLDVGRPRHAVESFAWASALHPENAYYAERLTDCLRFWHAELERRKPPRWPDMAVEAPQRRLPEFLPREVEQDYLLLIATENLLKTQDFERRWWGPQRCGYPVQLPWRVTAVYEGEACHLRIEERPGPEFTCPPVRPLLRYPQWSPPSLPPTPPPIVIPALGSGLAQLRAKEKGLHWRVVVELPEEERAKLDLAEVQLSCMADLPDAENVDIQGCLAIVGAMTRSVKEYTEGRLPRFRAMPERFEHSEGRFRILCLITHLQRDLGVRYNPAKIPHDVPFDTADTFLHGVLLGNGGTCCTMPVLYAAIGRRLGYPIKLVETRRGEVGHLFARWDDPNGERFNIEGTAPGFSCPPDDYFRTGEYGLTPEIERAGQFLVSMTPRMELAGFLMNRGLRWLDLGRRREAVESFVWGMLLQPESEAHYNTLAKTETEWREELGRRRPKGFPPIQLHHGRRWPEEFPQRVESCILLTEVTEAVLDDRWCEDHWWGPLRRRENARLPTHVRARCDATGRVDIEFDFGEIH